jgi:hypothetical protein
MMAFFKAVAATKSMNHQNPSRLKTFDKDDSKRLLQNSTSSGRTWNNQETLTNGIATFLDGMSRAVVLPFGPILVNRLLISAAAGVDGTTSAANTAMKLSPEGSSKVPFPYALVVMAYIAGRALGYRCFQTFNMPTERLPRIVARISGIIISLCAFTFGSGLQSVSSLVLIRLVAGFLVGTLCAITRDKQNQCLEDDQETPEWMNRPLHARSLSDEIRKNEEGLTKPNRTGFNDHISFQLWTAGKFSSLSSIKIYLSATAISTLLGGLIYRHATGDVTFQALTQTNTWFLSPAFFVAVVVVAEVVMRFFFHYVINDENVNRTSKSYKSIPSGDSVVDCTPNPLSDTTSPTKLTGRKRIQSANSDVFVAARERLESTGSFRSTSHRRSRSETTDSDYFFDCQSILSDMEDMPGLDNDVESPGNMAIARYQDRRMIYSDGSPAHVPSGDSPDVTPKNYITICNGNVKKAQAMWQATQNWRREQSVWKIHRIHNKWFPRIKQAYPHFVHGFSKDGCPIIYEQPGKMNLKNLFRSGCSVEDMVRHYVFLLEYISNHVCTREEVRSRIGFRPPPHSSSTWGIMVVMDVKGAGLTHLSGDVFSYLKCAGDINNSHYPLSLRRAFAINAPFWLAGAWSSIRPILPETVHVDLLSSHQFLRALRERIDDDQIPPEYGGSSPYKLGEHPFENDLYQLVEDAGSIFDGADPEDDIDQQIDHSTSLMSKESFLTMNNSISHSNLRHRATSLDERDLRQSVVSFNLSGADNDDKKNTATGGEVKVFLIASLIHSGWMMLQGILEISVPLWIPLPPVLGGLGYAPSRSGVALFSSSVVLLWAVGVCLKSRLTRGPRNVPMQCFRIALGTSILLLVALAVGPGHVSGEGRTNSILVMTITIILMSSMILCCLTGHASSNLLNSVATTQFSAGGEAISAHWLSRLYGGSSRLLSDCEYGYITTKIAFVSELTGVAIGASILSFSLGEQRTWPMDGTLCFNVAAFIAALLYLVSFSIHLRRYGDGGFFLHAKDNFCSYDLRSHRCMSFLFELISVSVSDMASLFDEDNWGTSPLLGRQGSNLHQQGC